MTYLPNRLLLVAAVAALTGCGRGNESVINRAAEPPPDPPAEATQVPERHVVLTGQPSFRDLGGYETADGRRVKPGEIYRSGELPHLTDEDVAKLEELEIQTVVNFLLPEEIEMNGQDRLPAGAREVAEPIQGDRAAELTMVAQRAIKSGEFEKLPPEMNPANRPLAFHCSHGVHRTGTATAILLSALGVPWETVREDYLLTNEYRREEVELLRNQLLE